MDLEEYHTENTKNFVLQSLVPQDTVGQGVIIGIDEAGRGPVLGPMVYGACYVAERSEPLLTALNVADSKALNECQREACFAAMQEKSDLFGWIAQILSPATICRCMLSRAKYNLNSISHDSAMFLIQAVADKGLRIVAVYLDTVGDPGKYEAKLRERFPEILKITVSKKADSLYPVVSAASIVAKVCRDKALKEWRFAEGGRFQSQMKYGSGYPSDPETKRFLMENSDHIFGYPQLIRFSWSTTATALERAANVTWEENVAQEDSCTPRITDYFKRQNFSGENEPKDHRFFVERRLKCVSKF